MGCWKDSLIRDFPIYSPINPITPDFCINQCSLKNYKYAGLQGYVDRNEQSLTYFKFFININ